MAAELIVAPEVERDLATAYDWYEDQRVGLGDDFLSRIDACIQGILRNPELHKTIHESYRRGLVRRFPYAVYYEYTARVVTIYCVLHTLRDPEKWRRRLP